MNEKEKELEYIKKFSKIKISTICKKLKLDKSNLWAGKMSLENIIKIKNEIQDNFKKL